MRKTLIVLLACLPVPAASAQGEKGEERAVAAILKLGGVVKVDRKSNRVVEVDFAKPGLTDEGLKHLAALKELKTLDLGRSQVTNAGLQYLGKELKGLLALYLSSPQITDDGLTHLRGLTGLIDLHLSGLQVGDAGLKHLQECKGLKRLTLKRTKVSDNGVRLLQKALPELEIHRIDPSLNPENRW